MSLRDRAAENFGKVLSRAVERVDGWANVLTGIGAANRDKRMGATAQFSLMQRNELEAIWRGQDMAARAIELVPHDMMREGFDILVQDTPNISEMLMKKLTELEVHHKFEEALKYERAYGGSAILIGADDGQDMAMPLDETRIRSLDYLTTMAAYELHPIMYYADPQAPKFGEPMVYQLHPDMPAIQNVGKSYVPVHESRIIRFHGVKVSRRQMRQNNGWGDSILVRMRQTLLDFDQTWGSAALLMQDFAQAVMKVEGLADLISTNQDDVVIRRAQLIDMMRSTARMVLLDSTEEFERKPTPLSGMPEMLDRFATRLAAAAGIPVTLLMGQSPAGLNATGASDVRFHYDNVKSRQHNHLEPKLCRLIRLLMLVQGGITGGQEVENWSIEFHPLWQPTALETAQARLAVAQADQVYITNAVVSPAEVAESRFGGDGYSPETTIDTQARTAQAALDGAKPKPKPGAPVVNKTGNAEKGGDKASVGEAATDEPQTKATPGSKFAVPAGAGGGGLNGGPT